MMKVKRCFAVLMIFFVLTIPETKQISEKDEDSEIIEFPYMASYGQLEGNEQRSRSENIKCSPHFFLITNEILS